MLPRVTSQIADEIDLTSVVVYNKISFNNPLGSQVKPKKKPDAKRYSEGDNNDEKNDAGKTDDHGDPSTELIRTEGKPGWVEKVLRKLRENFTISIEATGSPNAVLANRKN